MKREGDWRATTPAEPLVGAAGYQAVQRSRMDRERLVVRLRGFVVVFGVVQGVVAPGDNALLTWVLIAILCAEWLLTGSLLRRDIERFHAMVGLFGMAVDVVICALALANNLSDPADPIFLIVVFIALEAALRWGRWGGTVGGIGSGLAAAIWGWAVMVRSDTGKFEDLSMRFFTVAIVGGVTGGLVRRLDEERARLARLAYTDALTGLANRPALHEELAAALAGGAPVALVFLDLDGFKAVNDELGHTAGDAVLMAVAERMRDTVRGDDTVARLGGDEFVVVVRAEAAASVADLANRLRRAVEAPIEVANLLVRVGASFGTVVADPGDDVDGLLRRADHAMYEAKRAARPLTNQLVPELAGGEQALPELVHDHALVGGVEPVAGEPDA
jgi:diguanylate cyclase (GGDEF)-like protein